MNGENDIPLFEDEDFIPGLNSTAFEQSQQPHANTKTAIQFTVSPP